MRLQWIAGAGAESLRVRRLGEAVLCLMVGLIVLSVSRATLSTLAYRLNWSSQTVALIYIVPLIIALAANGYTLLRIHDRIILVCFCVLAASRTFAQATYIADVGTGGWRDVRIAASGLSSILIAVIFYRLVQILLITEEKRKQQVLDRLAESTSHRIGTNFLDGLVAAIVDVLQVRMAFVSEIDPESRAELILSSAAMAGESVSAGLRPGIELNQNDREHWQGETEESLFRIDLMDNAGQTVGCLGLMGVAAGSISPGQQSSLRIFAARAAAEILRVQADRRSSEMEAQMLHVQKLESLGVLAGGIAHDFNNLLQAISGSAAITSLMLPEFSEARKSNDQIQEIVEKGASMCHRLLAYAGRAVRTDTVCSLNAVVADTASIVQAARPDCSFALHLSSEPLRVLGDEAQLTQVIINLLTNAADSTEGESGRVEVRTAPGSSTSRMAEGLRLQEDGDYAIVEVIDNGCGIDDDAALKVFDPFYTSKGTGRGIGLAVVLGIVRDHHGDISFRARETGGTTFTVAFPLTGQAVKPAAKQSSPPSAEFSDRSVLLVDDDEAVLKTTRLLLEFAGMSVTTVGSGAEALRHVGQGQQPFDCILIDQTMPGLSGVETCERLRRTGVATPVILMSGFTGDDFDLQQPQVTFLSKPYAIKDLLAAIDKAISGARRSLAG